jgi:hypothetical protein
MPIVPKHVLRHSLKASVTEADECTYQAIWPRSTGHIFEVTAVRGNLREVGVSG